MTQTQSTHTAVVFPQQRDGSFGDLLVQVPALHALKAALGADRVVVIAPHAFCELLSTLGVADEVHIIPDESHAAIAQVLNGENPRWAISFRGSSLRTSWLIWRHTQRHCQTAGWSNWANRWLFKHTVARVRDDYYALVFGRVTALLGAQVDPVAMSAAISQADPADTLAGNQQRFIAIPAGQVDAKQWGADNYLDLGAQLKHQHPQLVLTVILGPREKHLAESFTASNWQVIIAPAPRRLSALCRSAWAIVANDCGPGHLAQMSGAPLVTLFHNDGNHQRRAELITLWWWRRAHSRAITTATARPISDIPVSVVEQQVSSAVTDDSLPVEALWWA